MQNLRFFCPTCTYRSERLPLLQFCSNLVPNHAIYAPRSLPTVSIMLYYIISITYQKIGDLFCLVHIYGLSHSVTWPFFCHSLLNISLSMSIVHSGYISLENKRINILQYGVRICKHPCQSRSLSSEAIDYWFDVILEKNVWLFLRSLSSEAQNVCIYCDN